jgi:hypothetical protein
MEGEGPEEDRSTRRDNSMILLNLSGKGGHGTSLFCFLGFLVYTATRPVWYRVAGLREFLKTNDLT